jgi:aspartate aminotransferase
MKDIFSSKVNIPPSATVTINTIAQQKKLSGQRVYNLSAGEPIMNTAQYLKETVDWAMEQGQTLYPPVAGIDELRARACHWMNDLYKTNYEVKNTLITCGGKFGIYLLLQTLLNDGDEVIIISPYWVSYPPMVSLFGGRPVIVETEEQKGWKVRPEQIAAAATAKTKLLILNNGSNPTGVLYTEKELAEILKICKEKNIIVMSDEVYSGLTYDGKEYVSCGSFWDHSDHVVVIQSCSKNFGMTGWRVGMVFATEEITKKLITVQGQSITGTSIISQWAAITALEKAHKITPEINKEMKHRRDVFISTFNELFPGADLKAPHSSFYCFIPMKAFDKDFYDDVRFCERVLEEANVAMVPGTAFGKLGYVRTSFGAKPEELKDALKALAEYLKK